jgi:hypothetical protein
VSWGLVEVMGHARYAGVLYEVSFAGVPLLRVEMPEVVVDRVERDWANQERDVRETFPAAAVELGGGSIFRLTRGLDEARVRKLVPHCSRPEGAESTRVEGPWRPRADLPALPGPVEEADEVSDPDGLVNRQDEGADDLDDSVEF